jgi:EmrB/QacA subfamily drug resistance transporter
LTQETLASGAAAIVDDGATRRGWIVPAIIGSSMLMLTLESNIMANALPSIAHALHEDPLRLNMAITMFLLASAVFLPVSGWVADRFGARKVLMACMLLFAVSSAGCGFAQTLTQLIFARIAQGAAAAMILPVGRLVLLRTTPKHELVGALSVLTMPAMIGPVVGPVLGGFIVTYFDWRWIFFINLPIALLGVILIRAFVPNIAEAETKKIDWIGVLLTGVGLASLMFGFENLGRNFLPPPAIVALFAVAAGCFVLYRRHARRTPHAIIDLSLFRLKTFAACTVGGSFMRMAMGATPFLLAMLLQVGFGMNALEAGTMTFFSAAGALTMKGVAPPVLRRFGFRAVLIGNAVIVATAYIAFVAFRPETPHWILLVILTSTGFFRSLQMTSLNALAYAEIEPARMSQASTTSSMAQQLMQTVGVGLAATMLFFIQRARGGDHIIWQDVLPTFMVLGVVSLISIFWFVGLPRTAGDELHARTARR